MYANTGVLINLTKGDISCEVLPCEQVHGGEDRHMGSTGSLISSSPFHPFTPGPFLYQGIVGQCQEMMVLE